MLESYFRELKEGSQVRKTLIALRKALKAAQEDQRIALTEEQKELLRSMLADEDPKSRRNAALILGESGDQDSLDALMAAYDREDKRFVRPDYLEAAGHLRYEAYLGKLKNRMLELMAEKAEESAKKHRSEEIRALRSLILQAEKPLPHRFTGWKTESDLILTVSPGLEELTRRQLPEELQEDAKLFKGGVEVITDNLERIRPIRTVRGILMRFCRNPLSGAGPEEIARSIAASGLLSYMEERHAGEAPFYFRIDLKNKMDAAEKSRFISRLSAELEELTDYKLQNAPSDYECELRITQNSKGRYYAYLRLNTIPDRRFAYRKKSLPTSMHPVRAAEIIELVKEYLTEYGIVLDPMCGNGTLLIERSKAVKARSLYGVDIYGEAVQCGRDNAREANTQIFFINRDLSDFRHEYAFDEILTQFPARTERNDTEALERLCRTFVRRVPDWLKAGGIVIADTTDPAMLKGAAAAAAYLKPVKIICLSEKTGEEILIYRYEH